MTYLTLVVHVLLAISLIVLVLLQQGKGAEAGAAFGGGGASQTVFGSRGSTGFLAKLTGVLVLLFFVTSLAMAAFAQHPKKVANQAAIQQQDAAAAAVDTAPVKDANKSAKAVDATPASVDNSAPAQDKAPAESQRNTRTPTQ